MLNGKATKMPLHLSYLCEVLDKFGLFGLTLLFHMIFDDLDIALDQKIA
jgi:hypothetical protein